MKQSSTLILLFALCISFVVAQNCKDRGASTCPSSECCSQYGWCGTTVDHCSPSNNCAYNCWTPTPTNSKIFVGYIPSWMTYYPSPCNLNLNNLNVGRFTHLNIPFAEFSSANNFALYPQAGEITNWYNQVIALKSKNTKLKVLISVGGGAFGPTAWATMASTATNRQNFVNSAISFARARNFDGIDIDWEFPTSSSQTPQIVSLFSALRSSINAEAASSNRPALLLTIAAPNYQQAINFFNFPVIHQYLDWINVMTYDYAGDWSSAIGANTALNGVTGTLSYFTSIGVPTNKLVMGFANYARTFTLRSSTQNTPGSPFNGKGVKGSCTNAAGSYNYNEVANFISSNPSGTYRYDSASNTPYFFSGLQWVTYDNPQSLQLKVNYLNNQNLRGAMVWALDGNYTITNFVAGAIGL